MAIQFILKTILLFFVVIFFWNQAYSQFISEDDKLHALAGALISSTSYAIVYSKTKNKTKAFWYSLGLSTFIGLSKEIYDGYIISGRFDTGEAVATSFGGLVASATFNIFTDKKKKQRQKKLSFNN